LKKLIINLLRKDKPESITSLGFILLIMVFCFAIIYMLMHKMQINWYSLAAFAGALFGTKVAHSYINSNYNNPNPDNDDENNVPPDISGMSGPKL
jgi:hypothetical protein